MAKRLRSPTIFFFAALLIVAGFARGGGAQPSYTDAFYHFNAASQLARGGGFVEEYLWNYLDAPNELPAPSHRYWMPLTSILAALGMALPGASVDYTTAQAPSVLLAAGAGLVSYHVVVALGGNLRCAWIAGLLTAFGGYFAPRWGAIDTIAPFAFFGSLALFCMGKATAGGEGQARYWILAGCLSALCHLTRPDGVLLLFTAFYVALASSSVPRLLAPRHRHERFKPIGFVAVSYLLLLLPWFMRNLAALGVILPSGGISGIWFSEYDELFRYSGQVLAPAAGDTLMRLIEVRWQAALHGFATFIAVEGIIVLAPFMLYGWWRRRHQSLLRGFTILAIAIHSVMILVFPLQGYRGGLFHSVAALFPFWMALGIQGLEAAIDWAAARRRPWNTEVAKPVFSGAALAFGAGISLFVSLSSLSGDGLDGSQFYRDLDEVLPARARVMINDPARLYYRTRRGGVTIPNDAVEILPVIAERYDIGYLVLEHVADNGAIGGAPAAFQFALNDPPEFLRELDFEARSDVRLFQILSD